MALLDDIGTTLSTNSVASSSGDGATGLEWYLWKGHMPDSTYVADRGVAVIQTAGYAPDAATEVDRPGVQVLTRGVSIVDLTTAYEETEAKAVAASAALHALTPGSINGRHYVGVWAEQDPFFAGLDDSDRPMFSQNFRVQRSRT